MRKFALLTTAATLLLGAFSAHAYDAPRYGLDINPLPRGEQIAVEKQWKQWESGASPLSQAQLSAHAAVTNADIIREMLVIVRKAVNPQIVSGCKIVFPEDQPMQRVCWAHQINPSIVSRCEAKPKELGLCVLEGIVAYAVEHPDDPRTHGE